VSINPNANALAGQQVTLTIAFNDSRYSAGHSSTYQLTIDGITWDSTNGCSIAGVKVNPVANGINTPCTWAGLTNDCTSYSVNGYLQVITKCNLPQNLVVQTHILSVTPTIYSNPTQLNPASTTFSGSASETHNQFNLNMIDILTNFFKQLFRVINF